MLDSARCAYVHTVFNMIICKKSSQRQNCEMYTFTCFGHYVLDVCDFDVVLYVHNAVRLYAPKYDRTLLRAYAHFLQLYGLQLIRLNIVCVSAKNT